MSAVKHQPATPLPPVDVLTHTLEASNILNAEYLARAGHAYPKLVEALRGLALRHDDGTLCFDGCEKAELCRPSPFCARYNAILRDLGEAS